jgi:hypothetical protein
LFERGFKTWCEKLSLDLRKQLGKGAISPLDPRELALHLKIRVLRADEIQGLTAESLAALGAPDSGWSAVTLDLPPNKRKLILLNHTHSEARQSSDLMHELAHHLCNHSPAAFAATEEGHMMLENYSKKDEEEADWLAGCLLLPRPALVHIKRRVPDLVIAAEQYIVSLAMLKYRLDITGVNYQFKS